MPVSLARHCVELLVLGTIALGPVPWSMVLAGRVAWGPHRLLAALTAWCVLQACGALALGACSSSSKSDSTTSTTTSNKALTVDTPDGQASLALNGALPPGWPTDLYPVFVPLPSKAAPTGRDSIAQGTTARRGGARPGSRPSKI